MAPSRRRGGSSPPPEDRVHLRQSPSRRSRPRDVASGRYHPVAADARHEEDRDPATPHTPRPYDDLPESRKRKLVRPERSRIDADHPNYHYSQHAAAMNVMPSSTGNDAAVQDPEAITDMSGNSLDYEGTTEHSHTRSSDSRSAPVTPPSPHHASRSSRRRHHHDDLEKGESRHKGGSRSHGRRKTSQNNSHSKHDKHSRHGKYANHKRSTRSGKYDVVKEQIKPPSFWNIYCAIITFWCPGCLLSCVGIRSKAQQRAWREKMGLISIILVIMAFVGFLTFGFTQVVCGTRTQRLHANDVDSGFLIIHGEAYNLLTSAHPAAPGIPARANVLYDLPEKQGGKDASFLFQNVNGHCKGLITRAQGSDVPTDEQDNLAWYFPCTTFNQDGSSAPNLTVPFYSGYACHTSKKARDTFYLEMEKPNTVFFTWDDIKNSSRNLIVYSGNVLDLNLLHWFNSSQVDIPDSFKELRDNSTQLNQAVRGRDVTRSFQSSKDKKRMAECLTEIAKVGSIDTESVGCIASKVVLYLSLVLILTIVSARFALALFFQWFVSRRYGAAKTSQSSDKRKRQKQIEEWSEDIYRAPARMPGDVNSTVVGSDRTAKRSSFLPTTSRFSAVYGAERTSRRGMTTMANQASAGGGPLPRTGNDSRSSFLLRGGGMDPYSTSTISPSDGPGPAGFIHEGVVAQPPADWMPFGFPLAHTICLVTAYSEGAEGIRTTLDSIAMTDYPNSHKVLLVICDGIIKGKGETLSTPDMCLSMMTDLTVPIEEVQPFSYVAVASGAKRHNMAKVYAGFYDYGPDSVIPREKQQRVPMMCVVKCGTEDEANKSKPGNRGKRDSQIILMSFLQKVMFDERMTELEYEMFNGLWKVTGISPDYYEIVLMVDADTKVFPDSLTHMISAMVKDPEVMGLCGETKIANKRDSWVSAIQVFEYFISHHLAKSFESVFGGVTCLPGCFCMYRIKTPKGAQNYWVPILANPDVVEHYSENVVDTLHKKNLLLLGEDRYLSTLMLRTFPKRKQIFVPQAVCKTTVPDKFMVLLSQRRRWINSTIHNLMELVLVRDLCGTFCFSMQFVVFIELMGTLVLPAAIAFTFYVVISSIVGTPQIIPLILLALILGLPAVLIVVTAHSWTYVVWMIIYLFSLPVWNFVLPTYAFWKFDDFSWGDTRKTANEVSHKGGIEYEGEFDSSKITMKRWADFERDRRLRAAASVDFYADGSVPI